MNGGYLMISKTDSDIYAKAQKALVLGKPILFYENQTTCYYIDTISGGEITTEIVDDEEVTTYGDIILTKGGKTITITSANAVSESGDIQPHLYALSFNVSDMYYTIFTKISCGMNDKIINTNVDDYSEVTLTSEEQKSLSNAMNSALCKQTNYVIMNISGDSATEYFNNNSSTVKIDVKNTNNDGYSLRLSFASDVLTIANNPNDDDINIYEEQLF